MGVVAALAWPLARPLPRGSGHMVSLIVQARTQPPDEAGRMERPAAVVAPATPRVPAEAAPAAALGALAPQPAAPLAALPASQPVTALRGKPLGRAAGHPVEDAAGATRVASQRAAAASFEATLLDHLGHYQLYPEEALRQRLTGVVLVVFAMDRSGAVLGVWLKKTSGQAVLDTAAMAGIRRAVPLPAIPPELPGRLTVQLPVAFAWENQALAD